jgi:hypothetical protein
MRIDHEIAPDGASLEVRQADASFPGATSA